MTNEEQLISSKLKTLQHLTKLQLSYSRVMSKYKITDQRGRDIFGNGWQDAHVTLCHIDTVITFTLINRGYEVFRDEVEKDAKAR